MNQKTIEEFDRKQKLLKHKRQTNSRDTHGHKRKQTKRDEVEDIYNPGTSYRDRAQERREGINKDFDLDPDDIKIIGSLPESHSKNEDLPEDVEERRRQEIEESKYLGGDLEHTHLVKGLDFALLEKMKDTQKRAEKLAQHNPRGGRIFGSEDTDSEEEEFITEAILAASATSNSRQLLDLDQIKKGQSTEIIPCRTTLARRILNTLGEKWPINSDLFLPGRMTYTINLDDDAETSTVTTILKSKADSSNQNETASNDESNLALDQLIGILARIRTKADNPDMQRKVRSWDDDIIENYRY